MKISTALFASILSICLTAGYVSGQISFPDGSVQTTAFDAPTVTSADRFNFTTNLRIESLPVGLGMALSPVVPAGQELVILQIISNSSENLYTSRLPSPDELTNPIDIAYPPAQGSTNFPDGTVVVDEGRQLWVWGYYNYLHPCSVLGYYRDK